LTVDEVPNSRATSAALISTPVSNDRVRSRSGCAMARSDGTSDDMLATSSLAYVAICLLTLTSNAVRRLPRAHAREIPLDEPDMVNE
jgi:hypothetical protein